MGNVARWHHGKAVSEDRGNVINLVDPISDERATDDPVKAERPAETPARNLRASALGAFYFSDELIELNFPLSVVPIPLTATTMTIDRKPAIIAYSIAVAPD